MLIQKRTDITNKEDLSQTLYKLSIENKNKVVLACTTFGTVRIYMYDNRSSVPVDTPEVRETLRITVCIGWCNGIQVKPTKGWQKRNVTHQNRSYNR